MVFLLQFVTNQHLVVFLLILKALYLLLYKSNLLSTLLFAAFNLCSRFKHFFQEIVNSKDIFYKYCYPSNFIHIFIKKFFDRLFIEKKIFALASKKELICVISFISTKFVHNTLPFSQELLSSHFASSKHDSF